jgi:hypothetical protein
MACRGLNRPQALIFSIPMDPSPRNQLMDVLTHKVFTGLEIGSNLSVPRGKVRMLMKGNNRYG